MKSRDKVFRGASCVKLEGLLRPRIVRKRRPFCIAYYSFQDENPISVFLLLRVRGVWRVRPGSLSSHARFYRDSLKMLLILASKLIFYYLEE